MRIGYGLRGRRLHSRWRYAVAGGAAVAAAAHVPVTPQHLREAPYLGWLFVGFTLTSVALAVAVLVADVRLVYVAGGALGAAAIAAYSLFRMVPMPLMEGEVGMWYDPYGVAALVGEVVMVGTAGLALLRPGRALPR